jgi:hypothetical protein
MSNDMAALRAHIFDQLAELRATSTDNPEAIKGAIAKAGAVSDLAKVLTDTAKVEVEYIRAVGGDKSSFLEATPGNATLPSGITGIVRHQLKG